MFKLLLHDDWPEVSEADFEAYLKDCPDYTRNAYSSGAEYFFRHNGVEFAHICMDGSIRVNPEILVKE